MSAQLRVLPPTNRAPRLSPAIAAVAELLARVYARELTKGGSTRERADNAARPTSAPPGPRLVNLSEVRTRARRTVDPAA